MATGKRLRFRGTLITLGVILALVALVTSNIAARADSDAAGGICDRTQQVQDAILAGLSNVNDCAKVTDTDLEYF